MTNAWEKPRDIGTITEVGHIRGIPAAATNVVTSNLQAQSLFVVKHKIHQIAAERFWIVSWQIPLDLAVFEVAHGIGFISTIFKPHGIQ
jgi:hypothetical protein